MQQIIYLLWIGFISLKLPYVFYIEQTIVMLFGT
jgi:hypothetical protein